MGQTLTPTFIVTVEHKGGAVRSTESGWNSRQNGRPNGRNLKIWVDKYHESLREGECNHHVFKTYGAGAYIASARILRNDGSREVVAIY